MSGGALVTSLSTLSYSTLLSTEYTRQVRSQYDKQFAIYVFHIQTDAQYVELVGRWSMYFILYVTWSGRVSSLHHNTEFPLELFNKQPWKLRNILRM